MHGRRRILAALAALACLLVPAGAARATVDVSDRVIGQGAIAGGVDLSSLTVAQAADRLQAALGAQIMRPVTLKVGRRTFQLGPERARVRFDALRTAKRAYYAARDAGAPVGPPTAGGTAPGIEVPLALSHSHLAVRAWAQAVRRQATRPARDASLRMTLRHMIVHGSRPGWTVDVAATARRMDAAFDDPAMPHTVRQPVTRLRPKLTVAGLRHRYGTVLTVDRSHFRLRLFKRLRFAKSYPIAVGMAGLETPAGLYAIHDKQVDPAWHVPDSDWAGSLAGHVIPGGAPDNPLRARWLGIQDGIGIHGTNEEWTVGSRASHGCIRMRVADVIDLYPRVPVGTPVLIG